MKITDAINSGKIVAISTEHCPGCKQQKKILEKMKLKVEWYDLAEVEGFAQTYGVMKAPTIAWKDNNGCVCTIAGPVPAKTIESVVLNSLARK